MKEVDDHALAWVAQQWLFGRKLKDIGKDLGHANGSQACIMVKTFCNKWSGHNVSPPGEYGIYGDDRKLIVVHGLHNFLCKHEKISFSLDAWRAKNIRVTGGLTICDDAYHYQKARKEHAWLLRWEGMIYRDIGRRLGVSSARARELVLSFDRDFCRAVKKIRFHWLMKGCQLVDMHVDRGAA